MPHGLIGMGANLGDRAATLDAAVVWLRKSPGVDIVRVSRWHETTPVGGPADQPSYLNGAVLVESALSPAELLGALQTCEDRLGRTRSARWGARTIDLDLLLLGDCVIRDAALTLPHPRMAYRRFVLTPAAEIAPDMRHPTIGWTMHELLDHLDRAVPYVAITSTARRRICAAKLTTDAAHAVAARSLTSDLQSNGPTGPSASRLLELLNAWRRILDRATWPQGDSWTISDFWFEELLIEARVLLPPEQRGEFERQWEQGNNGIVHPMLTVMLDDAPTMHSIRDAALIEQLERLGLGPTLRLPADDLAAAKVELLAAIEAMRP